MRPRGKIWYVMHEMADKPVADGTGRVLEFATEPAALEEAQRLTEDELQRQTGYSFFVLERTIRVSPVARTSTVRL